MENNQEKQNEQQESMRRKNIDLKDNSPQDMQEEQVSEDQVSEDQSEKLNSRESEGLSKKYIGFWTKTAEENNVKTSPSLMNLYGFSVKNLIERFATKSVVKNSSVVGFVVLSIIILPPIIKELFKDITGFQFLKNLMKKDKDGLAQTV